MSSGTATTHLVLAPDALFESMSSAVAHAPSRSQTVFDRAFRATCFAFALFTISLVGLIVLQIAWSATPAVRQHGLGFLSGRVWDPNTERYGILAETWGTLYTSILALVSRPRSASPPRCS